MMSYFPPPEATILKDSLRRVLPEVSTVLEPTEIPSLFSLQVVVKI